MERKVILRKYNEKDASKILSWVSDERIFRRFTFDRFDTYPITKDEFNDYYENSESLMKMYPLMMEDLETKESVGHICLTVLDEKNRVIKLGMVVVDSEKRGFGYGRLLLKEAIRYAKVNLKAERILIGVFEDNTPAINLYSSIGFKETSSCKTEYTFMSEKWNLLELEYNENC